MSTNATEAKRKATPMDKLIELAVAGLTDLDKERLLGWQGPPGAAYNVISEELCEAGLLNADWSLSPFGLRVRAILAQEKPNG